MAHDPTCKELDHPGRTCSDITRADPINHPPHYTQHPSGVECITITEHYNFNVGNAIKYLWRAGLKDGTDAASDLRKAAWYVRREIERLHRPAGPVIPGTYVQHVRCIAYVAILPRSIMPTIPALRTGYPLTPTSRRSKPRPR